MVTKLRQKKKTFYLCDVCGMAYEERELAEKCQAWCDKYHTCNLEIIDRAVPIERVR